MFLFIYSHATTYMYACIPTYIRTRAHMYALEQNFNTHPNACL